MRASLIMIFLRITGNRGRRRWLPEAKATLRRNPTRRLTVSNNMRVLDQDGRARFSVSVGLPKQRRVGRRKLLAPDLNVLIGHVYVGHRSP